MDKARYLSALLVFFSCNVFLARAATASNAQANALLLFRAAIDHTGKLAASWIPTTNACIWQGITCNATGAVTKINLQGLGLQGQLPLDQTLWSTLNTVQNINLANNNISGFLPPQMAEDTALMYLTLRDNQLSSPLPSTWANLTGLKGLDLGGNGLFGTIPTQWSGMSSLQSLDLSRNQLSNDSLDVANLANLKQLSLAGNPKLCSLPAQPSSASLTLFYGPCNASSPVLPGIDPIYVLSPSPAPNLSPPVSPAPPKPMTFVQMNFQVSGADEATFTSKDESAYKSILASAAKLSNPSFVDVTVTAASPASPTSAGRRLLQSPAPASPILTLQNVLYTADPNGTLANLQASVADGSLARQLATIGLTLNPTSVVYPASSSSSPSPSPSPLPSSGSGSNTGAIVGGVVGGVVGAAILIGVVVLCLRNNRKKDNNFGKSDKLSSAPSAAAAAGTIAKSNEPMYTANPAFNPEVVQPVDLLPVEAAGPSITTQPQATTAAGDGSTFKAPVVPPLGRKNVIDNAMFDQVADPMTTPRPSARGTGGQNQLFDSQGILPSQSDLSGPQSARSRMESARSGLTSNPAFAFNLLDDDNDNDNFEEANNALYQSARSGTDIMATAESDLQLDSARTYESAQQGSIRSQTLINPLYNSSTVADGVNPLYDSGKQSEQPSSARRSG